MADKTNKQPEGVPGKWYVDTTCVPCNSCMDEAPNLLKYSEDQSHVFFAKQAGNAVSELKLASHTSRLPADVLKNRWRQDVTAGHRHA